MDLKTIIADKMVFGGNSIGKIDGKAVFIPYGIPGEKYEIRIVNEKSRKDYDIAEIVNILEKSPSRVQPQCPYYGVCGGCNLMHIDSKAQVEFRKEILKDLFSNNGIELCAENIQVISGPESGYRARFQLTDGGLSEKRGNTVINIKNCVCAEKPMNDYLNSTDISERPRGRIQCFASEKVCALGNGQDSKFLIAVPKEKPVQNKIQGKKNRKLKLKENHYFAGTSESPENTVCVELDGKKIWFDVRGFFQSNLFVFEKTCNLIKSKLGKGKNVLDMYAGCGSISVFLKDNFENLVLVEHNRDALVFAERNLAGTKHTSYGLSGENWAKNCSSGISFDAAVIDPPRSGMEKSVLEYLKNSGIPFLACLSCDPATQARDISYLQKNGYYIDSVHLLDFYPNTSHIESLVIMKKVI